MKLLIILAIGLALGGLLIGLAASEPGFVLLQYGQWTLETSLLVFAVLWFILLFVGYLLLRSLVLIKRTPTRLSRWQQSERKKRAAQTLTRGLITLEEGRWVEAERILLRHVSDSETPLLHYLAAARAAQKQKANDRRDMYLKLADESTQGADIAVGVVQAELQISAGQKELALATLQHLRQVAPKHPYVLQLLQQLYQDTEQWQAVQSVLPDLRKRHVLDREAISTLGTDVVVGQLQAAYAKQDWRKMEDIWLDADAKRRQEEPVLSAYIEGLIAQGEHARAASLIEQYLAKQWSDVLVYQYGLIAGGDEAIKRLATAEKWLKQRENNPWLLLTLGRLSLANQLWAKAETYLRNSVDQGARPETYQALADVLMAQEKREPAALIYRQGLSLALSNQTEK